MPFVEQAFLFTCPGGGTGDFFVNLPAARDTGAYFVTAMLAGKQTAPNPPGTVISAILGVDLPHSTFTITAASTATPIVITTQTTHPFNAGDKVSIWGVQGNL